MGLAIEKAVPAKSSVSEGAVWRVFDPNVDDAGLWVSRLFSYGWVATYAPGAGSLGYELARGLRGKHYRTRRELLDEVEGLMLGLSL